MEPSKGLIFGRIVKKFDGSEKTEYWKVTHHVQLSYRYPYTRCQRCTKTGKTYSSTNGFFTNYMFNNLADSKAEYDCAEELDRNFTGWFQCFVIESAACSRKGVRIGQLKRRLKFLKNRIIVDLKEVTELENQIYEESQDVN